MNVNWSCDAFKWRLQQANVLSGQHAVQLMSRYDDGSWTERPNTPVNNISQCHIVCILHKNLEW